jgi:predicted permease
MSWARVTIARVRALFGRGASERELEEELRFHVEMRTQDHLRSGMSLAEARTAAHRDFGGFDTTKEHYRDVRGVLWLETLCKDVVHGSRSLARDWVFSIVAILSLMLGIGGNAAIFSLIDTVLLRSLPVRTPEQLRFLKEVAGGSPISYFSVPWYKQIRNHTEVIDGMLAFFDADGTLLVSANAGRSGAQPELVRTQLVSGNYFSVLGVRPAAGREFSMADDAFPDSHPVAVISYSYWHRRFNASPTAIGAKMLINGNPFTVVGVTPPEFSGLTPGAPPDISVPLMMQSRIWLDPGSSIVNDPKFGWLRLMVRLRADLPEPKVRAGLSLISRQIDESLAVSPAAPSGIHAPRIELSAGQQGLDALRVRFSTPLLILMLLVGLVLLIACTNIAVLLLARAAARQREIGTRLALGATRLRLICQLLTESSILAAVGAMLGLLFAYTTSQLLLRLLADSPIPINLTFVFDRPFLLFTGALTVVTALICGLLPAIQTSKADITTSLSSRGLPPGYSRVGPARFSYAKLFVVIQLALSLVLLVAAGLFVRSLSNVKGVAPGFDPDDLLLVTINPSMIGYRDSQLSATYETLLARMREIH